MKSKIVLGASLAIATLSLVSLVEIEGLSPFLIENVSANTHSANKVINHKVSIYLENADEGKGLTVNFSTDSVSPNLFDEFEKKSGITITTMLVNAKTGEVVEKRLTPSVFLRSNDLTSGTISSFIFSEYPDGEYKYVVSKGDFIDPKTQFKHQYRGESPVFRIRNRKYVELGTTDKKLDERRDNSVYKDGVVEHKVNLSLTSYQGGNGVTAIFSTDSVNSNLLNSFGEKAKKVLIRSKLINVKTGEVIDETFSPKVSLTSKILKSGSTAVFYFIDLTDGEYKYVAYESQQYTDPQTTLTHQYRGESPIFSIKDGKFSGLVSASKPDENPKPTPKPDEKPKPSAPQQEKTKPTVQSGWVGSSYYQNGYMAKSEWIYDKNYGSYYYLTSEGSYARNTWSGNYYLKSNGKMAKSEWVYDSNYKSYYYLTSEGSYARNTWVGNYYLKSNGKMAVNERTPDGYRVDGSGKWVK
ncbi:pneumococcal surface protein [Streptococcus pneumoniae]|nr:pneumococcal surface protein [Streptococcus pneumoniae]VMZ01609.1 pneumococcal surface protein [Streptococcus pneumoniae]